jgi:uncharacterized membrane protein YphA (DoxX/SURF4 family)
MTFSQYAGTAIVPTLARLVLAAVFVSTGWNKVKDRDFDPMEAARLRRLGVNVAEVRPVAMLAPALSHSQAGFRLAAYHPQAQGSSGQTPDPDAPPAPDAAASQAPAQANTQPGASGSASPVEPLPPGQYRALGMYGISLMLEDNGFSPTMCVWGARVAAFTELLGGAMLLLGLFSRLWGLGLAVTMGVAFYLVSMKMNHIFETNPFVFAQNHSAFSTAAVQLSLFVLAFGIFLTGAGPLSIDRILFGRDADDATPGISPA